MADHRCALGSCRLPHRSTIEPASRPFSLRRGGLIIGYAIPARIVP